MGSLQRDRPECGIRRFSETYSLVLGLVVGASHEWSAATGVNGNQNDNSADNSGAAYVFVRSGTTWSQQAYLKASNTGYWDHFGGSVAVEWNLVLKQASKSR